MKLTLILPKNDFLDDDSFVPPLGPLYVAKAFKEYGLADLIRVITWDEFKATAGTLGRNDIVGLTGASVHEAYFKILPNMVKSGVWKIAGGPLPTFAPERILSYGYDIVVKGSVFSQKHLLASLLNGSITLPYICDMKDQSWPWSADVDFSLVDKYFNLSKRIGLMSSQGCTYSCAFCAKTTNRIVFSEPHDFVRVVRNNQLKYNPEQFIFYDDNILARPKRFIELANQLAPLGIRWRSQARSNCVTRDIIDHAIESGCEQLSFGVESGSQKILDNMDKRLKVEQNTKAFAVCKEAGLKTKAFIILGLPGETQRTIKDTQNWILEARPDIVSLYTFFPFEGSRIYCNTDDYDIKFLDLSQNFYAAKGGISPCCVETSELSAQAIEDARLKLKNILELNGIIVY